MHISLADYTYPLLKRIWWLISVTFIACIMLIYSSYKAVPDSYTSVLYGTIAPTNILEYDTHNDVLDGAERFAEAMSGWGKDPYIHASLEDKTGIKEPKLKRILSIKKQNKSNIYATLSFEKSRYNDLQAFSSALEGVLIERIKAFNSASPANFGLIDYHTTMTTQEYSLLLRVLLSLPTAMIIAFLMVLSIEFMSGKITYKHEIYGLWNDNKVFIVRTDNDKNTVKDYIHTLSGYTYKGDTTYNWLPKEHKNDSNDTIIIVITQQKTMYKEVHNLAQIYPQAIIIWVE